MSARIIALITAALCACTPAPAPSPTPDAGAARWHTEGQAIYDPEGRERILYGINATNEVKYAPYTSWAGDAEYRRLQTWGFSAVRLLTSWAAIMPRRGEIDERYLAMFDQRVAWARAHNLLVVIDMHQDVYGEGFGDNGAPRWACDEALYSAHVIKEPWWINYLSPQVLECFHRFWTDPDLQDQFAAAAVAVASRYVDTPNVIGVDLINEPMWGSDSKTIVAFHRDQLQPFYERVMDRLEAAAPQRFLYFVEPATITQLGMDPEFRRFTRPNVVYEPHYYYSGVHDHHAYDPADKGFIANVFGFYQSTAVRLRTPWVLGEWGGFTDSTNFDVHLRDVLGLLEGFHAGAWYYDLSRETNGFAPLNDDGSEKPAVLNILSRVYPKATGGTLVDYSFDDVQHVFRMTLETRDGVTAPTVLALPARHYPNGFVVESSDEAGRWAFDYAPELAELSFTIDRDVKRHTVTVKPK